MTDPRQKGQDRGSAHSLSPEELASQETATLPNRQVMSLIDPNALGASLLGSTTGATTDPTGSTGTAGATQPAGDATSAAGDTAAQGTTFATHALPDTSTLGGQSYQPTATSTAQS